MAYTSTDLTNIQAAIIALARGSRVEQVIFSDGKSIRYGAADLEKLQSLEDRIKSDINTAAGTKKFFRVSTSKGL